MIFDSWNQPCSTRWIIEDEKHNLQSFPRADRGRLAEAAIAQLRKDCISGTDNKMSVKVMLGFNSKLHMLSLISGWDMLWLLLFKKP